MEECFVHVKHMKSKQESMFLSKHVYQVLRSITYTPILICLPDNKNSTEF